MPKTYWFQKCPQMYYDFTSESNDTSLGDELLMIKRDAIVFSHMLAQTKTYQMYYSWQPRMIPITNLTA